MKKCKRCGIEKELSEFSKQGLLKSGNIKYRSYCKECGRNDASHKEYCKEYYIKNKDSYREYYEKNKHKWNKEGYCQKRNKERDNNYSKDYMKKRTIEYNEIIHRMFDSEIHKITYIIISNHFCKIGQTTNLFNRIKHLKRVIKIDNIYIINKNIEKRLIGELKKYRFSHDIDFCGKTECFKLPIDILDFIINREKLKEFIIR